LFGGGVAAGAPPPVAGAAPPTLGTAVVGLAGITAVPPGESVSPALDPAAGTGDPAGTLGAPGSDVPVSANGDGVVNVGTGSGGGIATASAGAVPVCAGETVLEVAAEVPAGGGVLVVGDVGAGASVVAGAEPTAVPGVGPAGGVTGVNVGAGVVMPTCASATGAPPALKQMTGTSMRANFLIISNVDRAAASRNVIREARLTAPPTYFSESSSSIWPS